ncbi:sensor histidine kinase [Miniphocaeibacter massiliensis]|uniref:sensor histidine kinase n=1 Tax=Miniphocaeibacter massiliensis TaxID=2041841 RepID=UPI000C1C2953|nr:sensor histidine kinase [Miniphocaeibacter massiliensis]
MNLSREFLKTKISEITIILSIFLLNAVIMYLTNVKFKDYYYVIALFLFFYCIYLGFSYSNYVRKYKEIKSINSSNIDEIRTKNLIEKEYLEKIKELYDKNEELKNEKIKDFEQLEEDYSIWIHQAKTPIAALSLIVDSIELKEKDDIKQELFKINQYTEMALANIRLQDINTDIEIREHDLYNLVRNTVKKYALYFNYQGDTLELNRFCKKIVTDEKWFSYVLDQIISNAVKYTKNGKIKIYTTNDYLVIEDSGIGIKEEDIPKLFTRGFTGYTGRVDKKATGLGLYMSKKILSTLGSHIYLESSKNKGTKVYIKITENR